MNRVEQSPDSIEESPLIQICTACGTVIDISEQYPLATIACPACSTKALVDNRIDHFDLQEIVGRGGMGVVYKAHDPSLDRFVALKLLRLDKTTDAAIVQQMATEAAITASINHPHVVRVFTTGTDRGRFFIAMELVDKGTLDQLIQLQGRVAESQALEVGIQIAQGLRAAQQAGLIHRDVKPGNILFANSHSAKIVDFGLAIFMEDEEKVRGEVWGTPYYVAPEKLDNQPEDFRSDIYSLGGTLFHALAGRPPFEAEDASMVALKHLKSQAVSLQSFAPHVSNQTAYVINRTLAKDPAARYQSYDELIEHLEFAREQLEQNAANPQKQKRVVMEDEDSQRMMGWITLGMVALLILGGLGALIFRKQIFGTGQGPGTPAATASKAPGSAASATATAPFPDALRALADGDAADAVVLYRKHLTNPKFTAYQVSWANFGEALSALAAGKPEDARNAFQAVVTRGIYSTTPSEAKPAEFLRDTARRLSGDRTITLAEGQALNPTNYESIGILLFALKELNLGRNEQAIELLQLFRSQEINPTGRDAWIAVLKPLASQFLQDLESLKLLKTAKTSSEREAALPTARKIKGLLAPQAAQLIKTSEVVRANDRKLSAVASQTKQLIKAPEVVRASDRNPPTAEAPQTRQLINKGSEAALAILPTSATEPQRWLYTTEDPGNDWMRPEFSDAGWKKGNAPFGNLIDGFKTNWATSDLWLRREVTLPAGLPAELGFEIVHDDEIWVYINGVPAFSEAKATREYMQEPMTSEGRAALKPGINVIAVHCHQGKGAQYFDLGIVELGKPAASATRVVEPDQPVASATRVVEPGKPAASAASGWAPVALDPTRNGMTIRAAGADLWRNQDAGHFAYRTLEGDGEFVARLNSLEEVQRFTKVGLMLRESLDEGSRNVAVVVSVQIGVNTQIRPKTNALTTQTLEAPATVEAPISLPQWLKLVRKGDTVSTFYSSDGTNWSSGRSEILPDLPRQVFVGLAVASHDEKKETTAKFDQIKLQATP